MNTYQLFKDVIETKNFKLDDMRDKIIKSSIRNQITEEEEKELLLLASQNIDVESERPDWLEVAKVLSERITAIEEYIQALENDDTTDPEETTQYEKWTKWDGISEKYQLGDIVEHNGILYENILANMQNTWEPGTIGTEALWRVYEA